MEERTIDSLVPVSVYFLPCLAFSVHVVSWIARAVCHVVCMRVIVVWLVYNFCVWLRAALFVGVVCVFAFVVCVATTLLGSIFASVDILSTRVV